LTNQNRLDNDGIRGFIDIYLHKLDIENLWFGKPLAFVDDLLFSSSVGFSVYSLMMAIKTFI
jgi:hypothetical protein